jgi:SAM-dependent methyltransferase
MSRCTYALDNSAVTAPGMLDYLTQMLNSFTIEMLRGAGLKGGSRCLDLGAGNGSVAHEMAQIAGPHGRVVAVDIDPRHIPPVAGVEIVRCDVVGEKLPAGPFDVIHDRLMGPHLSEGERRDVLTRAAGELAPGGVIALGSWGLHGQGTILSAPDEDFADLHGIYRQYKVALVEVLRGQGNDPTWALQAHRFLLALGLGKVQTIGGGVKSWRGGTAGCMLPVAVSTQLQDRLVRMGMTIGQLERMRRLLKVESTVLLSDQMLYTLGFGHWVAQ